MVISRLAGRASQLKISRIGVDYPYWVSIESKTFPCCYIKRTEIPLLIRLLNDLHTCPVLIYLEIPVPIGDIAPLVGLP